MSADYTVVFRGTEAEGERRTEVMRGVQELLKIGEQHIVSLFDNPQGVTLYNTDDLNKAERLIRRLERVGARAELIDNRAAETRDGADNDDVSKRKRIRRSILESEHAGAGKTETGAKHHTPRRPTHSNAAGIRRTALVAAGVLGIGVLGALAINRGGPPSALAPQAAQAPPATPTAPIRNVAVSTRTLAHANSVAGLLTGIDWQQVPSPLPGDSIVDASPEPWLDAAPTAAGGKGEPPHAADAVSGKANTAAAQIDDDAMGKIVSTWQSHGFVDPLGLLRIRHLASDLVRAGHADRALSTLAWVEDPEQRLALLNTIARQAVLHDDATLLQSVRGQLDTMSGGQGNPSDAVLALLALDNMREKPADATARATVDARLLRLINGSQLASADAVVLHALVAAAHADTGSPARWFAEANHLFRNIEDPVDQLNALARLARAYRATGDQDTADQLVLRIRAGSDALGKAVPGKLQVIDQLVQTYVALGHIDAASQLIGQTAPTPLDADLQRAQLAIALAAHDQVIAARGLVTTIAHPIGRARANTRLSAIAALRNQYTDAQLLADAAVGDIRRLPPAVRPLLTSDLTQPLPDDIARARMPDAVSQSGSHTDHRLAIVATNLAWNRAGTSARQLSQGIGDETLRAQTQERIDELATLFGAAASVNLAGTLQ